MQNKTQERDPRFPLTTRAKERFLHPASVCLRIVHSLCLFVFYCFSSSAFSGLFVVFTLCVAAFTNSYFSSFPFALSLLFFAQLFLLSSLRYFSFAFVPPQMDSMCLMNAKHALGGLHRADQIPLSPADQL